MTKVYNYNRQSRDYPKGKTPSKEKLDTIIGLLHNILDVLDNKYNPNNLGNLIKKNNG